MPRRVAADKVHEFFAGSGERAALAVGVTESATSRDEAWQFFTLGRSLERADMTARLLATRTLTDVGSGPSWTTILRSCGAYEAYLRTYRGMPSALNAAEFLLLDRLFPRSVVFSLRHALASMADLAPRTGRVGVTETGERMLGQVLSSLQYTPIGETVADLPGVMQQVQRATSATSEAIRQRYFPSEVVPSWVGERL